MKKIMKILLHIGAGIMLSVFIYRYGEAADSHLAEMTEVEKDVLPNRSDNDEVWNMTEDAENVIGEIEILEKSMYVEEEIASMDGWIVTKYLKYPYFTGGSKKVTDRINEQIFQTVMHENMAVEDWVTYIEMTYEITFEDEQYLSILLEGNVSRGGGYGEYSRGMNFDMESGELLSMEDICEWTLIQEAVKNATMAMDKFNAMSGYRGTSFESVALLEASRFALENVKNTIVPESLRSDFGKLIDEYVRFNEESRNNIMERMTPNYMYEDIGKSTQFLRNKDELISSQRSFYKREKEDIRDLLREYYSETANKGRAKTKLQQYTERYHKKNNPMYSDSSLFDNGFVNLMVQ